MPGSRWLRNCHWQQGRSCNCISADGVDWSYPVDVLWLRHFRCPTTVTSVPRSVCCWTQRYDDVQICADTVHRSIANTNRHCGLYRPRRCPRRRGLADIKTSDKEQQTIRVPGHAPATSLPLLRQWMLCCCMQSSDQTLHHQTIVQRKLQTCWSNLETLITDKKQRHHS